MSSQPSSWFENSASEAVLESMKHNKSFLAFVYDESEQSARLNAVLEAESYSSLLKEVCIKYKVKAHTSEAIQLAEIFPVENAPRCIIVRNGVLLHSFDSSLTEELLLESIKFILADANSSSNTSSLNQIKAAQKTEGNEKKAEAAVNQPSSSKSNLNLSTAQQNIPKAESKISGDSISSLHVNTDTRKNGNNGKKLENKENNPILGRSTPSESTQSSRSRFEDKTQERDRIRYEKMKKEMIKAKKENDMFRKKVLEEIAENRKARKELANANSQSTGLPGGAVEKLYTKANVDYSKAKLSVKLVDGTVIRKELDANLTFGEFVKSLEAELGSLKMFEFTQPHPSRTFEKADYSQTLAQLELSPSASLVVKKCSSKSPFTNSFAMAIVLYIWKFIQSLLHRLYLFFLGVDPSPKKEQHFTSSNASTRAPEVLIGSKKDKDGGQSQPSLRKRQIQRGRKSSDDPSDDSDNVYYNGNTTNIE